MTLPTPPSTSHRHKEGRSSRFPSGYRVVWSDVHQYHTVPSSPPHRLTAASSAKNAVPTRSILKQTPHIIFPLEEENKKEVTPEPSDPLTDLRYLEGPVSRIIASDASLRDLIEAYSVLATRIRACAMDNTDADASWPLFQPLRKHRDEFVDALVRDLGRIFVDPESMSCDGEQKEPVGADRLMALPSPKESPKKKKGMSEDQVKFARDLCTVCHVVIKLLNAVFTLPALYRIFTDEQLQFLLTHVLAIPLANEIPTPNARKTCALSIWLLQTQRLPGDILVPAKDRITYALRRGIEGELGKEGKKGSMNDGLKAIHDLSISYPTVFIPAFTELLPSILSTLLAPTLVLRSQACHALGGFAFATASLPQSAVHTRIADLVSAHLTTPSSPPSSSGPTSPTKDPAIVRTLRTVFAATEPKHAAQGPVWGWSVLASFIVLLGPNLYLDTKVTRVITALSAVGMRHQKSSVRALGSLTWRCMVWACFHAPPVELDGNSDDEVLDDQADQHDEEKAFSPSHVSLSDSMWKVLSSVVDMGAGVSIICALLAGDTTDDLCLGRALKILRDMSKKGGHNCKDALDTMVRLVSLEPQPEWNAQKLLPLGLFSASPGLLTTEYKLLPQAVRPLFEQCAQVDDLRSLTKEELALDWVFEGLLKVWMEGLSALKLTWGSEMPAEILDVWQGLMKGSLAAFIDAGDEEGASLLGERAIDVLIGLLENSELDLSFDLEDGGDDAPTSAVKFGHQTFEVPSESRWNFGLKLYLVRELFNILKDVFPTRVLGSPAATLLSYVVRHEVDLLDDIDVVDEVRYQWISLCAEIAFACELDHLDRFWCGQICRRARRRDQTWIPMVRRAVWHTFVERWNDLSVSWEAAGMLLGAPFMDLNAWDMSSEDLETWDGLLRAAMDRALDYGIDSVTVIDKVASAISSCHTQTLASSTRVADLLLSHLEISEARQLPIEVLEFTNDTLISAYPPEPRNKVISLWLIRSLTRIIDACPMELAASMFEVVQEGLSRWVADEHEMFADEEYAMDILPVYQTILLGIQSLPPSVETLEALSPLIESAFCGRQDKPEATAQAFEDFWQAAYVNMPEPHYGWPERIQNCLDARSRRPEETVDVAEATEVTPTPVTDVSPDVLFAESEKKEEQEVGDMLVPSVVATVLAPAIPLPLAPCSLTSAVTLPSTPKSSPRPLLSTPSRPKKQTTENHLLSVHPPSPNSPLSVSSSPVSVPVTPKRSPRTPRRSLTSSGRRRSTENKENVSPLPIFASVTERIAMQSPASSSSILGKRRQSDGEPEERVAKKSKLDFLPDAMPAAAAEEKVHSVLRAAANDDDRSARISVSFQETTPHAAKPSLPKTPSYKRTPCDDEDPFAPSSDASLSDDGSSPTLGSASLARPRKRKGTFLDAVEVPTFREVLRSKRQASLQSVLLQRVQSSNAVISSTGSTSAPERTLRRTRSATKVLGTDASFEKLDETPCKRRKRRVSELGDEDKTFSPPSISSPLRALREVPLIGSDDSIMLATPTKPLTSQLSSDDDPHTGQITPLGLTSPALFRVREEDSDPPSSDDSNMSASPVREHVKRRLARMPSSKTFLHPSPAKMRSRLTSELLLSSDD